LVRVRHVGGGGMWCWCRLARYHATVSHNRGATAHGKVVGARPRALDEGVISHRMKHRSGVMLVCNSTRTPGNVCVRMSAAQQNGECPAGQEMCCRENRAERGGARQRGMALTVSRLVARSPRSQRWSGGRYPAPCPCVEWEGQVGPGILIDG